MPAPTPAFIARLRRACGFDVPPIYQRLHAAGMLDWGQPGPQWQERELGRLLERPPLLLFADGFEIMGEAEILEQLARFHDRTPALVDPRHGFLPFGGDGSGDCYCLYVNAAEGGRVPVVHWWHDADKCHFIAADLQDFIFMNLLSTGIDAAQTDAFSGALQSGGLQRYLDSHAPFVHPAQASAFDGLRQRGFTCPDEDGGQLMLLSSAEQADWIERLAPYPRRGESFRYAPDVPPQQHREPMGWREMWLKETPPPPREDRQRITGQLRITLAQQSPPKTDPRFAPLRALNWRGAPGPDGAAVYVRKNSVFFGQPEWAQIDPGMSERIRAVLQAFDGARIEFIHDGDGKTEGLA